MTQETANIEVPAVLKECLLSLTEIREKIANYYPESAVTDCVEDYAYKFNDIISDAVYNIGEMIRFEVINTYYFKEK